MGLHESISILLRIFHLVYRFQFDMNIKYHNHIQILSLSFQYCDKENQEHFYFEGNVYTSDTSDPVLIRKKCTLTARFPVFVTYITEQLFGHHIHRFVDMKHKKHGRNKRTHKVNKQQFRVRVGRWYWQWLY